MLVLAAAALTLAASALVGWRLLGAQPTDSFSEIFSFNDALIIAEGRHKFGIVEETHYPSGGTYTLLPWVKYGIRDIEVLRRVPFTFALFCEGLLLAAIVALRVSATRRLWLILALGTIFLQPGVVGWLGGLHEHSFVLSFSFALLAAAISLRKRFRLAAFALTFLTGWFGYDFFLAQFFGTLAIRWLIHCQDASDDGLPGPLYEAGLDALCLGGGMGLAVFTHFLQNVGYFGSFTLAFNDIAGAAAARMALQSGAGLNPAYYNDIVVSAQTRGNMPRLDILQKHAAAFFSAGWIYPRQFVLLGAGILLTAATAMTARRISINKNNLARIGVFAAGLLFCVCGWIYLMPRHADAHLHFLPRHFFIASAVLVLAGAILPEALSRPELIPASGSEVRSASDILSDWFPLLRVCATLGFLLAILSAVSHGPSLQWKIFILSGLLLSVWALATRLKWRPAVRVPEGRLAAALLIGLCGASAYALLRAAGEFFSGGFSLPIILLSVITAIFVVGKYKFERESLGGPLPRSTALFVALGLLLLCCLIWLETGRLYYWGTFSSWFWADRSLFWKTVILCALVPVLLLWDFPRSGGVRRKGLLVMDAIAVVLLFIFSFDKYLILQGGGDYNFPLYLAPVDYIRAGGHLLWDVPSPYGFLSILITAALPLHTGEAFYLVDAALIFLGTLVSYATFRAAWPTLAAPLIGIPFVIAINIFIPGWAPNMYGPQLYPGEGPFRYIACYLLILLLLLQQLPRWKEKLPLSRVMKLGSGLWLFGGLWSAESLAYCTAIWFPALLLLDGQAREHDREETPWQSFTRSASLLKFPAQLLGGAMALITLIYLIRIGHVPDFKGYFDYSLAFSAGRFNANAKPPEIISHWLIFFFFSNFLILMFSVRPAQKPLAAAGLFCSWAVSSYYAAMSYPHSLFGLCQFYVLALNIAIYTFRTSPIRGEWDIVARAIARATTFSLIPLVLMLYYYDAASIGRKTLAAARSLTHPFSTGSQLRWDGVVKPVDQFTNPEDRAIEASLIALLRKELSPADAQCVLSMRNYWHNVPEKQDLWLPFISDALWFALSEPVRVKYLDRFMSRVNSAAPSAKCPSRWLAYHDSESFRYYADMPLEKSEWKLRFLQKTMRIDRRIDSGAWHLVQLSLLQPH